MRYALRALIPAPVKRLGRAVVSARMFTGPRSVWNWSRLTTRNGAELVPLRIRALGGRVFYVRHTQADANSVFSTWGHGFHLPPPSVPRDARHILDLGANIGCTMADYAVRFPQAEVLGIELDRENHQLCERNLTQWADRCRVLCGAAWFESGMVRYAQEGDQDGYAVGSAGLPVPAFSVHSLIPADGARVDFLKMDIEGAEREVLRRNTDWAGRVDAIKVEVHQGYSVLECLSDLRCLGFDDAWVDPVYPNAIYGVRR